jgi:predicted small secreted protein
MGKLESQQWVLIILSACVALGIMGCRTVQGIGDDINLMGRGGEAAVMKIAEYYAD